MKRALAASLVLSAFAFLSGTAQAADPGLLRPSAMWDPDHFLPPPAPGSPRGRR
jgi:hypothetical protein